MIKPAIPHNEKERIQALRGYRILDTLPERDFDELTKIASEICQSPISLISLIDSDRQWFKSAHGIELKETPRELAFCAHAIIDPHNPFIVPDTSEDERFHDHPFVVDEGTKVMFYAGVPLNTSEGYPLGTLCVIDNKPKQLSKNQLEALKALANQVVAQMELRKKNQQLEALNNEVTNLNNQLSQFSYRVSHDLKAPVRGICSLSTWLLEEYANQLDQQGIEYLSLINSRADQLNRLIDGILQYSKTSSLTIDDIEDIDIKGLLEEVVDHCQLPDSFYIDYPKDEIIVKSFRLGLYQIFQNLITNAFKYNDKDKGQVKIEVGLTEEEVKITFTDNGPGIPEQFREKVFDLFETLGQDQINKTKSVGIGLSTVKSLTDKMGGTITICDRPDGLEGTCFKIILKRLEA